MEQGLENIVQELQMVSQQLVSVQTQVKELQGTIDHLKLQKVSEGSLKFPRPYGY